MVECGTGPELRVQNPFELVQRFLMFLFGHSLDVLQLPLNGGELAKMGNVHKLPVGLALFERKQKCALVFRELVLEPRDEDGTGFLECFQRNGDLGHSMKLFVENVLERLLVWKKHLGYRTRMSGQIDHECLSDVVSETDFVEH